MRHAMTAADLRASRMGSPEPTAATGDFSITCGSAGANKGGGTASLGDMPGARSCIVGTTGGGLAIPAAIK